MIVRICVLALIACLISVPAWAIHPDEVLKDPVLESRARAITREVRCLVCQGESIDESNAPLASDLRVLVRNRLRAGDSDDQVKEYLVARYGEYVLMRPPLGVHTVVLWGLPFIVLAGAGYAVARLRRAGGHVADADDEKDVA